MKSKVIFMDGIATAHLRDDKSVRIELMAGAHSNSMESSLARIPAAIRRALPAETRAPAPNGPYVPQGDGTGPERGPDVPDQAERAL